MKKLIIFLLLTTPIISFGQDTIHVKKVTVVNVLINPKTGKVLKKWIKSKKVKSGYIVHIAGNIWMVNNKRMYRDNPKIYSFSK